MKKVILTSVLAGWAVVVGAVKGDGDLEGLVEHGYAENDGVKTHFVTLGDSGPVVVMIHGFPDFWMTWRGQMEALAADHRVVAVDLRGYNRSDQPEGVEAYSMGRLVKDIEAVVRTVGAERVTLCGHDWGGMVAWATAMARPGLVERLMVLNLPHPRGIARELATNEEQRENAAYARRFQEEGAYQTLTPEGLSPWAGGDDPAMRALYEEAFRRSSFEGMLNYYRANYPRPPYVEAEGEVVKVKCPVLLVHGLEDEALMAAGLNGTWEWLESDLTLLTVPGAGHWVHHDAEDLVTRTMLAWLRR